MQYYVFTKDQLPMDVEFLVQDAFSTLRPQFKVAKTLEEAGNAFAEACKENYKTADPEKATAQAEAEAAEPDGSIDGDDDNEERGRKTPEVDDAGSSSDEAEARHTARHRMHVTDFTDRSRATRSFHKHQRQEVTTNPSTKRTSLSPAQQRTAIQKLTPNSIASSPSSCLRASKLARQSVALCSTLRYRCVELSATVHWRTVKTGKRCQIPSSLRS